MKKNIEVETNARVKTGSDRKKTTRNGKSGREISVFVDGSCKFNPGPGGYAFIIREGNQTISASAGESNTTNNRMEMTAVLRALERIRRPSRIHIFTDSQYLINGMTRWIHTWQKNNWRNANKEPVKNKDLWLKLLALSKPHSLAWHWVKGHSGHPENEQCDRMALAEAKKAEKSSTGK